MEELINFSLMKSVMNVLSLTISRYLPTLPLRIVLNIISLHYKFI